MKNGEQPALTKMELDELQHISKNQPVHDGDTLAASTKRSLLNSKLITNIGGFNMTTIKGDELLKALEK